MLRTILPGLIFALTLAVAAALPAELVWAAEWNFYGMGRMATFGTRHGEGADPQVDRDTIWGLQSGSLLRTRAYQDVAGSRFGIDAGTGLHHLFGTWGYGDGELLLGQSETPLAAFFSGDQVYNNGKMLPDNGQVFNGRRPMIQLRLATFKVALIDLHAVSDLDTGGDVDVTWPKLEISYQVVKDNAFVDLFGGYQTYALQTDTCSLDIDAYIYGIGGGMTLGPAYMRAGVYAAQNQGQYGLSSQAFDSAAFVDDRLANNDAIGGLAVAGYKLSDYVTFEAGFGMTRHELDDGISHPDETAIYYLNAVVCLAPGVFIVPELGQYDFMKDPTGSDEGALTYFGAKWEISF
jgi:hypothetical protein